MMVIRIKRPELIIAFLYTFRFCFKMIVGNDGNYDLMYLFAIYATMILFFSQGKKFLRTSSWAIILGLIWLITAMKAPLDVDSIKSIVFITKLMLCIYLFTFVRDRLELFDFQIFIDYAVFFLSCQTILALLQRQSAWFWRLTENRMELLFLEPSELGNFTGLLLLLQVFIIRKCGNFKGKLLNVILLCGILYFSSSLSGILFTIMAISIFLVFENEAGRGSISRKQIVFLIIAIVGISILLSTDNYISNRFIDALNGVDSSFNTRSSVPIQTVTRYFEEYGMFGFGFGNMNTPEGLQFFNLRARNYVICAAYFLFAIEGGIIAILLEVGFTLRTLYVSLKRGSAFHIALFVFLFFYMYLGGYTTNPVVWICYAILYNREEAMLNSNNSILRQARE